VNVEAFAEAIREAEKLIANPPFEVSEQDVAEGYDYLAGSIRSSLQMAFDYDLDGIRRLEDKGVTDCIVGFRIPYIKGPDTEPLQTKIDHLDRYAEDIISKVAR
jgi:hypothetical protein